VRGPGINDPSGIFGGGGCGDSMNGYSEDISISSGDN
jgi:hypothetical protein